jgi:hypothetical protein
MKAGEERGKKPEKSQSPSMIKDDKRSTPFRSSVAQSENSIIYEAVCGIVEQGEENHRKTANLKSAGAA